MSQGIIAEAFRHGQEEYPREACGLVVQVNGEAVYRRCRNLAENERDFILDPADYARAEDEGIILAIVHTHPNAAPKPSQADRVACEASGLPWYIVSVPSGRWEHFAPSGYKANLIGREFSYGVLDCLELIRDWYRENRGIDLPAFDHRDGWWNRGQDLYMENFRAAGFVPAEGPLEVGDVILMQIRSPVANHGAIYLGRDLMLHHLANRLSCREVYGGYWRKCTRLVIRYRGART